MGTRNKILSYEPSQAAPFNLTSFFGTCGSQILLTSFAICQTSFLAEWSQDGTSSSERTTTLLKKRHVFGHFEAMQCRWNICKVIKNQSSDRLTMQSHWKYTHTILCLALVLEVFFPGLSSWRPVVQLSGFHPVCTTGTLRLGSSIFPMQLRSLFGDLFSFFFCPEDFLYF